MQGRLPRSFGDSMDRADMKRTVHEFVSRLCDLAKSGDEEWLVHVDQIVNEYLAEAGKETDTQRRALADHFSALAPARERSNRIRERILQGP